MALKGNKGDWSEIYVFLRLLHKGKLDVADDNLNIVPNEFYRILEIIRKETETTNYFVREDDTVRISVCRDDSGETETFDFPIVRFAEKADELLELIKTRTKKDTVHPSIEEFLAQLQVYSIKDYGHKRDITIKIEDFHCGSVETLGFSIKSFLGHNPTPFNAGAGTNFIYRVIFPQGVTINCDEFNVATYGENKIKVRLNRLIDEYGAEIKFIGTQSRCMMQNLRTIDGDLPWLLAELLLINNKENISSSVDVCTEALTYLNPLDFDIENHGQVYEYKIKRFLQDCSLGMTPEKPWHGIYDASGGQIVVRKDGEVVCYHIYELNRYMQYLYTHTKFENASTSEDAQHPGHARTKTRPDEKIKPYKYGWLYEDNGEYRIKLNLQIRFK